MSIETLHKLFKEKDCVLECVFVNADQNVKFVKLKHKHYSFLVYVSSTYNLKTSPATKTYSFTSEPNNENLHVFKFLESCSNDPLFEYVYITKNVICTRNDDETTDNTCDMYEHIDAPIMFMCTLETFYTHTRFDLSERYMELIGRMTSNLTKLTSNLTGLLSKLTSIQSRFDRLRECSIDAKRKLSTFDQKLQGLNAPTRTKISHDLLAKDVVLEIQHSMYTLNQILNDIEIERQTNLIAMCAQFVQNFSWV